MKSKDKILGIRVIFQPLISELQSLEENGIDIIIEGRKINIKFFLGLIIVDNLGVTEILGFVRSFSPNHPCRACSIHEKELRKATREDKTLLRGRTFRSPISFILHYHHQIVFYHIFYSRIFNLKAD
jgi:hypothetical protein